MKKILILIPVFNDWESVAKLLNEINFSISDIKKELEFHCLIINDASTIDAPLMKKPSNIKKIKIINLKDNTGHARCNAFGVRYVSKNEKFDHLIVMDGDGEDRPEEIKDLVEKTLSDCELSVVAKRVKRSEGFIFQILYRVHKVLTFIFTGKRINFGNYSCLTKNDVDILSEKASLWSSFSGSLKNHVKKYNEVNSIRGVRYFGPSKMSLLNLFIHSFAIIAVFKETVFIRSTIMIILLFYLNSTANMLIVFTQILITFFCILIYCTSRRESEKDLQNSHLNVKNQQDIT